MTPSALTSQATPTIAAREHAPSIGLALLLIAEGLLAFAPVAILGAAIGWPASLGRPPAEQLAAFAALSALARALGILRWLTVMPALASAHAAAEPAQRAQIEQLFAALTAYGGGIGELLGVSLLMAIALGTLAAGAWRAGGLPGWLCTGGLVVAGLLAGLALPVFGAPSVVPVALAVSALSAWFVAAGIVCLRRR